MVTTTAAPNSQFVLPTGVTGRLAGRLMAVVNADMERAAIRALDLEGNERVLEIGFGPGVGVRRLMRRLPWGFVAGVDPSEIMLSQARRRNRRSIRSGLIDLRLGVASDLPWPSLRYDAVVSVNNVMLWTPMAAAMSEIRRVLKPGGRVSIGVHEWAAPQPELRDQVIAELWNAGFTAVKTRRALALSGHALYFTAHL